MPPSLGGPHRQVLWRWTREDATGLISGGESLFIKHIKPAHANHLWPETCSSARTGHRKADSLPGTSHQQTPEAAQQLHYQGKNKTWLLPDNGGGGEGVGNARGRDPGSPWEPWGLQIAKRGGP